jgi:two-component system, chemotaxis family, protein-glutamate methylesterase/glutaminase
MSASISFGKRVAGVLLTWGNQDGAQGLMKIKSEGGVTFVQRPEEAAQPTMPLSGLQADEPGLVSLDALPSLLISLATGRPNDVEQPDVRVPLRVPVMGQRRM